MAGYFVLPLCFLLVDGVFGDVVKVSVKEGESVTLNTDVTKQQHDKMLWYFEDTRIALIGEDPSKSCLYDGEGGVFRDRLEVDYESGSLTITNIRSEHTGRYELEIIRSESTGTSQSLNRNRKCDSTKITRKTSSSTDDDTIKTFSVIITDAVSVVKGDSVTLQTGTKEQYVVIRWYFNDIHIAQFDKDLGESCLYDGEGGIFSGRLRVDNETGSLTITNIMTEHAGDYEAEIIGKQYSRSLVSPHISRNCDHTKIIKKKLSFTSSTKKFTVSVKTNEESYKKMEKTSVTIPDSGVSLAAVLGICVVAVLLLAFAAVAGVIYYRHRKQGCGEQVPSSRQRDDCMI